MRLLVRLVLRGKALGGVLDGLLLWRLLGSVSGGIGGGGRRITLGVRVPTLIHGRVFAIPIFERDQYVHVQMCDKLSGWDREWRRKLIRKVKYWQDILP